MDITMSMNDILWMMEHREELTGLEKEWIETFISLFMEENQDAQEVQKDT